MPSPCSGRRSCFSGCSRSAWAGCHCPESRRTGRAMARPRGRSRIPTRHLILPAVCLASGVLAYVSRFVRTSARREHRRRRRQAARARGLSTLQYVSRHGIAAGGRSAPDARRLSHPPPRGRLPRDRGDLQCPRSREPALQLDPCPRSCPSFWRLTLLSGVATLCGNDALGRADPLARSEDTTCGVAARRSRGASSWSDSSRRRRSSRPGSPRIPTAKTWDRSSLRRRPRIGSGTDGLGRDVGARAGARRRDLADDRPRDGDPIGLDRTPDQERSPATPAAAWMRRSRG